MKIELDIDPGKLGAAAGDIMNALSPEERKAMAVQAMEKWLRDPVDIERQAKETEVVEKLKKRSSYGRTETDKEIRGGYEFRNEMQDWRSSKERMIEEITSGILSHYKSEVTRVIEADPRVQAMKAEVTKVMLETFPKVAYDAMTIFVSEQFKSMLESTHGLQVRVDSMSQRTEQVSQRLMQIAQTVGLQG
jgi:hypothetical protein